MPALREALAPAGAWEGKGVNAVVESVRAPKVDWSQIMVDLHNHGCSAYRVSLIIGVAQTTVYNWLKGGQPRYAYGRALLRLHSARCGVALTARRLYEADDCP